MAETQKGEDIKAILRRKAMAASKLAYAPYSKFKVGCALQTDKNKIYTGCNVENGSYGATICAERLAIFKAVSEGEKKISKLYLYTKDGWPPCGMCLQVMSEFAPNDFKIIIGNEKGEETVHLFNEIFPNSFTPEYLKGKN